MSTTAHPRAQLSAYLDEALAPTERAAIEAHVSTCPDCRARLAELRATAVLIRALPDIAPSRRLVPRVAAPPAWIAPLRTLSTLASGMSVFLFIATALLANIGSLAGPSAAAPALGQPGGAPAATAAASLALDSASRSTTQQPPAAAAGAPTASPAAESATKSVASAAPTARGETQFNVTSPVPQTGVTSARDERAVQRTAPPLGDPWLWLGVAVVTGALAIALQRRLRSA